MDLTTELPADEQLNTASIAAVVAWFQQRAGTVRELALTGDTAITCLSPSMTTAVVLTQCISLRRLELHVPACDVNGSDLGVLAACTQLTELEICQVLGPAGQTARRCS